MRASWCRATSSVRVGPRRDVRALRRGRSLGARHGQRDGGRNLVSGAAPRAQYSGLIGDIGVLGDECQS